MYRNCLRMLAIVGLALSSIIYNYAAASPFKAGKESVKEWIKQYGFLTFETKTFLDQRDKKGAVEAMLGYIKERKDRSDESNLAYADTLFLMAEFNEDRFFARYLYQKAKEIYAEYPDQSLRVADSYEGLIWTYDYLEADRLKVIELLEKSVEIRKKAPYSPQYSASLRILAWFNELESNIDIAGELYNLALEKDLANLGFNDIRTILAFENYALFYIDYEDFLQAEAVLKEKKKLHESITNQDLYNLGRTESMLGWVTMRLGKESEAENYYLEALKNTNISLTGDAKETHYYSITALFDLVYFYTETKRPERAVPYYNRATQLLSYTGEEDIFQFIQEVEPEKMDEEFSGTFPWSNRAHLKGVRTLLTYLDKRR